MKLVVIGGVAAGMSTAARARRLDENAEIVVLERSGYVSFANCGLPYHIGGVIRDRAQLLLQTPESLKASLDLDVRTGHEALAIDRAARKVRVREVSSGREYDEPYDQLALCPGATPIKPPLPGIDHPRVFVLRNMDDMDAIQGAIERGAKSAVVIGGGYIGVEMAENLRHRGLAVDLVEMLDQVMPPLDKEMVAPLEDHLRRHGVNLHLGTAAAAFRDTGGRVAVELKNGAVLTADLVVLSAGVRPDTALAKAAGLELGPRGGIKVDAHLRTSDPSIYAAGDAVETPHTVLPDSWLIPLAGPANRQGRIAAENICGRSTTYASTQGTAIVKIFDMTAGGTGAIEKSLVRAGAPFRKVYLHPSGHAGYYPGTAPMHIKVLFAPDTGRLLGAQVVGFDGVDKRLDVFATAIRAGLTVYDLENLELSYAPPFGSAKDPVNMAGFIGANLLRGDIEFWYAEDYPARTEGAVILDVRGAPEYETWHIPGAINIPLGQLRSRLGELDPGRPARVYCAVGFRSYLAYRLLKQRGFRDVANLSGGSKTFRQWHRQLGAEEAEVPFLSYAEEKMAEQSAPTGKVVELDCTALQCPGPILRLNEKMDGLAAGDEVLVRVADPGFAADAPAWCGRHGHELVALEQKGALLEARIRKGGGAARPPERADRSGQKTFVVFSGDLDRVMAAFIIANGALAMGSQVSLFFTFWGLNALRKSPAPPVRKGWTEKMFGAMMPRGAEALKLSRMNMLGAGTAMMKRVMKDKHVTGLPELIETARKGGARLIACTMTMDVMGLKREELIDGVELGGVATFLGEADRAGTTLFI
ncbi:MAG TPA: FAD-dependent oxidoreductase [Kiritimatiellia bacterium]|nr:FAD-dependent oxidoreductase [Kiritimatiellia bacterium]HRZ10880.1 FAD-dependent oxidoreductase [Kiritimatiellia bacterium]HSA18847.1 FAD-dependent oxidoreductase [Kiritimatiellia bacterium]